MQKFSKCKRRIKQQHLVFQVDTFGSDLKTCSGNFRLSLLVIIMVLSLSTKYEIMKKSQSISNLSFRLVLIVLAWILIKHRWHRRVYIRRFKHKEVTKISSLQTDNNMNWCCNFSSPWLPFIGTQHCSWTRDTAGQWAYCTVINWAPLHLQLLLLGIL